MPRIAFRSARWEIVASALLVAAAGYCAYLLAHSYFGPHRDQYDLLIYYRAVNFWADGHNIYDYSQPDRVNISLGYTYPALSAVLMRPMAWLSFPAVRTLTLVAIVLATALCVLLCLRERVTMPRRRLVLWVGLATAGAFLLDPVRQTLSFGQINMFLLALILLDVLVLARHGSRWTGIGVGLAMAIKVTPGIFLLYFLLARRPRAAVVAVVTAAVVTLAGAALTPAETWQYFTELLWQADRVGFVHAAANQSINGLLTRLAAPDGLSRLIWLAAVAVVAVPVALRIRRACQLGDTLAAVTLTGLLGVLISPVSWPHHVVWVIPAAVIIGRRMVSLRVFADRRGWWQWYGPAALLTLLGAMAWGLDLRMELQLPDVDFTGRSPILMIVASVQMWWCLAAVFLLPIERGADRLARAASSPPGPAVPSRQKA